MKSFKLVLYVIGLDRATRKSIPNKRARVVGVYTLCCCSCGNEMFTLNKKNIKTSDNLVRLFLYKLYLPSFTT